MIMGTRDLSNDDSWKETLKIGFLGSQEPNNDASLSKILEGIDELKTKLDHQNTLITRLGGMLSKMYEDGEINKDTFNKLDDFLKPYYENPYGVD